MTQQPLVSVIIPCYNVEKYIDKCMESVVNQTYKNIEILAVDDGSKDSTPAICDKWASQDKRIKVIHKANGGLSDARNVAIDQARGDYFVFLDGDDYIGPEHIQGLYATAIKHGVKMAVENYQLVTEGSCPEDEANVGCADYKLSSQDALMKMFYQKLFDTSAWGKIYHRSLFDSDIRYPKGLYFEDLATTYRLILRSGQVAYSTHHDYYYIIRDNSIMCIFSIKKYDDAVKIINQLEADKHLFSKKTQKALETRLLSFVLNIVFHLPDDRKDLKLKLFERVKNYRIGIIFNNEARLKNRVAAFLSYFGLSSVEYLKRLGMSRS